MNRVLRLLTMLVILHSGQQLTAQSTIKSGITDAQKENFNDTSWLVQVVVTANRGQSAKRSETPVAISALSNRQIQDAKAISIDQLLNKVSGVNMVDLGNEQHQMSIRQPMTTRSLFLYLEDGIPVRTTGLFNHNALLEMNMAATKTIEVIKGPSSSLYGSEAIGGVVNFITLAPPVVPMMRISATANNLGYKRTDFQSGFIKGKFGLIVNGYIADKESRIMEYNDFSKKAISLRADYQFTDKTTLTNNISYINYKSDMAGGIDSIMFATRSFRNPQTFTFRNVESFRYNSSFKHQWNKQSNSTATLVYRNNTIAQNPAYRIKDDYKKVNGVWRGDKTLAHGEINASSFQSLAMIAQHRQGFDWKNAEIIAGASMDLSPSTYDANYIRIKKDTISNKYMEYAQTDSVLTNYKTGINNYAGFVNFAFSPVEKLRIVASLRYDHFRYDFDNKLKPSAFSGSPDTVNHFRRVSPKIGLTYNFTPGTGIYINYSEGFIPPQVTEMFTGVKVPYLSPSIFYNYELGGWMEIIRNKLTADFSIYRLNGTDEIISVRLNDGSTENQNAGKTKHEGIEFGLNAAPVKAVQFRFSGAFSKHEFVEHSEKGVQMNGNRMPNAPELVFNSEVWYKPAFLPGFRLGAEVQKVGKYFTDPQNTATYDGYTILNLRAGYKRKSFEIWMNVMNATDEYYSNITTKSSFGWSYRLGDPRNFNLGVACDLYSIFNKK